jgi:hypothetical protein
MWLASGWRSDNNQALLELSDFARGRIGFSRVVCFGRFYLSGVYCVFRVQGSQGACSFVDCAWFLMFIL